ncbi:MAG: glycerophosphodiester phosphodiesterase family protein [Rhodothermales bacterium]|nr:glycerophosphodiester phosphodiesterase family protein [Rhodothermales bacterium]
MRQRVLLIRKHIALVVLVFSAVLLNGCARDAVIRDDLSGIQQLKQRLETPSAEDVFVVAHRTCWRGSAENSLAGIEQCVELGVDMVEIDVRETSDGELVLMHDETIDRTTNGSGLLATMSLGDVRELQLREEAGGPSAVLTDQIVLTLEEALLASKDRLLVNLDIKETLYDRALAIAESVGVADQIIIKMRAPADDPRLVNAEFHGRTYFMPIIRECTDDPERECSQSLSAAIPTYSKFDPIAIEVVNNTDAYLLDGVPAARALGGRLWVNTLGPRFAAGRSDDKSLKDPDGNWGYLIDHGVDMIQTDRPEALIDYLESRGARRAE